MVIVHYFVICITQIIFSSIYNHCLLLILIHTHVHLLLVVEGQAIVVASEGVVLINGSSIADAPLFPVL